MGDYRNCCPGNRGIRRHSQFVIRRRLTISEFRLSVYTDSFYMPLFCDVALAVPLDMVFTYAIPPGMEPVVGGRVLVPFRQQRLSGIVVELHDRPPQVKTQQIKKVIEALDLSPVLDEQLLKLGKWIADYYLAPVGEVFRTMLPLSAEFKRAGEYRIADGGRSAVHLAGRSGARARLEPLAASGARLPVEALRSLGAPRTTLGTLVRRGMIGLVDEPQDFTSSKLKPRKSPFEFEFSTAQKEALDKIGEAVASRKF